MTETMDLTVHGTDPLFYLINLDSATNRWEHFVDQVTRFNHPVYVKRFSAIHGDTHVFTEEETRLFENLDCRYQNYGNRVKGNQLSHYYILKYIVRHQTPYAIVCQDDVMFCDDFIKKLMNTLKYMPKDAEMVNIGFHEEPCFSHFVPWDFNDKNLRMRHVKSLVNDYIGVVDWNPCSLAYIITLQGAKNMVEHFDKTGFLRETDHNFNTYLLNKNIFYGSVPVLCTGTTIFGSSIFL
jgi:GR25 family glycosyltransferase involved in LPS biosynthesis